MSNKDTESVYQNPQFIPSNGVEQNDTPKTPTKEELITPPKPILKSTEKFKLDESTPEQPQLKSRIGKLLEYHK